MESSTVPPPPSAAAVARLVGLEVDALGVDELLAAAAGWQAVLAWAEAMQNEVLVALDRRDEAAAEPDWDHRWFADEVAVALGVGVSSAASRIGHARALAERLPQTSRALKAGQITGHHARLLHDATKTATADVARAVDAAVHVDPAWRTPRQAERAAARLVAAVDPAGAAGRHRRAVADRDVRIRSADDGMATLWALLPAADAQTVGAALEARARAGAAHPATGPDGVVDGRTLAQRRADALVELAAAALAAPDAPTVHGRRPTVQVTVAWSTLLGADDAPAELTGWGPIDADTARRIAADPTATWRRLLLDPADGRLLEYGRTVYRPPADLAEFVAIRDGACRHPACDRPAAGCDVDHRRPWSQGGPTSPDNLDALCRRHHRGKDEGGWSHTRDPDTDDSIWLSPRGHTAVKAAHLLPCPPALGPPPTGSPSAPAADREADRELRGESSSESRGEGAGGSAPGSGSGPPGPAPPPF